METRTASARCVPIPSSVASTLYSPGASDEIRKFPFSPLTATRATPRSPVTVTVAPGRPAPSASFTSPRIVPVVV